VRWQRLVAHRLARAGFDGVTVPRGGMERWKALDFDSPRRLRRENRSYLAKEPPLHRTQEEQ
jgi:hypothetical protein